MPKKTLKTMDLPIKKKRGPARWQPDLERVIELSKSLATYEEIAAEFDVSIQLIKLEAGRNPDFKAAIDRGRNLARISLRHKQYELAMAGDRVMLIWLGKQWLGQKNDPEEEKKKPVNPLEHFRTEAKIISLDPISPKVVNMKGET